MAMYKYIGTNLYKIAVDGKDLVLSNGDIVKDLKKYDGYELENNKNFVRIDNKIKESKKEKEKESE